jgi:hypothetical protein
VAAYSGQPEKRKGWTQTETDGSERERHHVFRSRIAVIPSQREVIIVPSGQSEAHVSGHSFKRPGQPPDRANHPQHLSLVSNDRMGWISDPEDEDFPPEASSSKVKITNGASCPQHTGGGYSLRVWQWQTTRILSRVFHSTNFLRSSSSRYFTAHAQIACRPPAQQSIPIRPPSHKSAATGGTWLWAHLRYGRTFASCNMTQKRPERPLASTWNAPRRVPSSSHGSRILTNLTPTSRE